METEKLSNDPLIHLKNQQTTFPLKCRFITEVHVVDTCTFEGYALAPE